MLVDAQEVLFAVAEVARVENAGVNHRQGARQVVRGGVPHVDGKMSLARRETAADGHAGWARRCSGSWCRTCSGSSAAPTTRTAASGKKIVWLPVDADERSGSTAKKKKSCLRGTIGPPTVAEKLLVWNGLYSSSSPHEHGLREHAVVVVVVADEAVEVVRSRLRRARHLDRAAAAVFRREGIDLDARLLDRVGVRRQVQHTLPDAARDVEPVDDELVGDRALTVRAGVDGRFRRIVVDAGSRRAGASRLSAAHRAQA